LEDIKIDKALESETADIARIIEFAFRPEFQQITKETNKVAAVLEKSIDYNYMKTLDSSTSNARCCPVCKPAENAR